MDQTFVRNHPLKPSADITARDFWESHYRQSTRHSSGTPSQALVRFTQSLPAGRALELGCAKGDDAVWLASQGWNVVAVDIAQSAIEQARANAERAAVMNSIEFQRHDLSKTQPAGTFDLVTAIFLQSPLDFPRHEVLHRIASAVDSGGRFLIVDHGSRAPWSWSKPDTQYPQPADTLHSLQLDNTHWFTEFADCVDRVARGPDGQTASVKDNVILLRRNG